MTTADDKKEAAAEHKATAERKAETVDTDVSGAVQPGGPWTPNPLFAYGRIDTSAGEGGESLHKINPYVFGVSEDGTIGRGAEVDGPASPEDIALEPSKVGSGIPEQREQREGDPPVTAAFASPAGTVDTSGPEGVHHEDFDPVAQPHTEGAEPNDANVDPAAVAGAPEGAMTQADVVAEGKAQAEEDETARVAVESGNYDSLHNDQLKAELSKRELAVGGNHDALVDRLKQDDKAKARAAKKS